MVTSISGISICGFIFQISCHFEMDQEPPPLRRDTGAQRGKETQFVFSEGDIYQSDGDIIRQQATCGFVIPRTIKLL